MAEAAHPSPRFTLIGLLELIAGTGLFLALVTQLEWFGFFAALAGFLIAVIAYQAAWAHFGGPVDRWGCATGLPVNTLLVLIIAMIGAAIWQGEDHARAFRDGPRCRTNLWQLGLALHNYYNEHGHFPPPYVADAAGKSMHSWRVLILPYLGRQDLYDAYDLNEPWNGPSNRKL